MRDAHTPAYVEHLPTLIPNLFTAERLLTGTDATYLTEVTEEMPLSWAGAFKKALIYFVWLIVWGIIGILMMLIGGALAMAPFSKLMSDLMSGRPATWDPEALTGIIVVLLGYIVLLLGSTATFIRLIYQLSYEATQEVLTKGKPPAAPAPTPPPAAQAQPAPETAKPTAQPPSPQIPRAPVAPTPTPPQVKYCAFCGKSIPMVARFCPFCQRAQP